MYVFGMSFYLFVLHILPRVYVSLFPFLFRAEVYISFQLHAFATCIGIAHMVETVFDRQDNKVMDTQVPV